VWFAERDHKLYVFTERDSYKVKRLRRDARVKVARCGALGRVTGAWLSGHARVVEDARTEGAAYEALRAKYGWQMLLVDTFSRLAGRIDGRAILEISLDGPGA
jgi:PPOX class probable F420-dependent enzyme